MPIIVEFILKNWKSMVVGAFAIGIYVYAHHQGYVSGEANVQAQFDAYKANQEQQVLIAQQAAKQKEIDDAKHTKDIIDGYEYTQSVLAQRLSELGAVPRQTNMRLASGVGSKTTVPATPPATGSAHAAAPVITRAQCDPEFFNRALEDTLQCQRLQEWVRTTAQ